MSMKISEDKFTDRVDKGLNDSFMRGAVSSAQGRFQSRRLGAAKELGNWEEWRSHGEEIRQHVLENLDYYLYQLSENVGKRGGHVFFAQTAEEATEYIKKVAEKKNAKKIVKSKSMVTEEIHLNAGLEELGCEVIETDLGEYILQVDNHEPPSHIVVPALHKNKEQIRDVFKEKQGYQQSEKPEELALHAREKLRQEYLTADIGITGCNFAIADTGSITLVTNEGNADLVCALPKTQITVMGMERLVPTFEEMEVLVSLLTRSDPKKLLMKAFGFGASSPALYKFGSKLAAPVMSPFMKDDKITKGPGPLKAWTDSRDFPTPNKERFRDWFKNRPQQGGKES